MANKEIELKIEVKGNALEELDRIKQLVEQLAREEGASDD